MTSCSVSLDAFLPGAAKGVLHPPKGRLKHPYIVPGGTYSDQLWDWDSFWVIHALLNAPLFRESPDWSLYLEHARGSFLNFFEHRSVDTGAVPILILPDKGDFFGCTRGDQQPDGVRNQAKPVLAQLALSICRASGDCEWLRPHYPKLLRFLDRWWNTYRAPTCDLLVWGSDVAIGVDSDPTTYGRPEFSSANLLLNCLYHRDLTAAIELARLLGESDNAPDTVRLNTRVQAIAAAIQRECWDPVDRFYYTVDVRCEDARDKYIPHDIPRGMDMSWRTLPLKTKLFTGFLPMWCGIASADQADALVRNHLLNESEFWGQHGPRSLAANERMYAPALNSANPSNWHGPVWIVAAHMIHDALRRYRHTAPVAELATRIRRLLTDDLARTGTLHECYNPDTGEPNFNAGFLSWNLLAALME
ncbi:glycogen debranching enzyme [Opitutaceae bacterium TAV1]|nr:glycogen debranching enzyme [Opitutaceae bacterium TAV1]